MRKAATIIVGALIAAGCAAPTSQAPASPALATPAATAAPTTANFPSWYTTDDGSGAGSLPPGNNATRAFNPGFTFTVPAGWVNDLDVSIAYGLFPDSKANEAEFALSGEIAQGIFIVSVESPHFFCEAWEKTQGTAAERSAFLVASDAFLVSEPVDVTIGGLMGKQIDVRLDPDRPTATCPGDAPTVDLGDQRTRVTYLDTPSGIIGISVGSKYSADHDAFLADAMPIVESFQFDLSQ